MFVASETVERENLVLFSKAVFQTMLPGMALPALFRLRKKKTAERQFIFWKSRCFDSGIASQARISAELSGESEKRFISGSAVSLQQGWSLVGK